MARVASFQHVGGISRPPKRCCPPLVRGEEWEKKSGGVGDGVLAVFKDHRGPSLAGSAWRRMKKTGDGPCGRVSKEKKKRRRERVGGSGLVWGPDEAPFLLSFLFPFFCSITATTKLLIPNTLMFSQNLG